MSQCITPMSIRNKVTNEWQIFPCGKCPECMKRRVSGWSFRLVQEGKLHLLSEFVTLTYGLDQATKSANGFMTLVKADLQKFFKRLRYFLPDANIRYYACGEYGSKYGRPHYHIILFGADRKNIERAWSKDGRPIGMCYFGSVTGASIGYVLKYMSKPSKIPLHKNDDRLPEFALMSKGLGANYMTPQMVAWHKADLLNRMYCNAAGGVKISMVRYFKDKIYSEDERKRIAFFAVLTNGKRDKELEKKMLTQFGDDWYRMVLESDLYKFSKMYKDAEAGRKVF